MIGFRRRSGGCLCCRAAKLGEEAAAELVPHGAVPMPDGFRSRFRAVGFGPGDELPGDVAAQIDASLVIHFIVNAGPDARVAGFLTTSTDCFGFAREKIGNHFRRYGGGG